MRLRDLRWDSRDLGAIAVKIKYSMKNYKVAETMMRSGRARVESLFY